MENLGNSSVQNFDTKPSAHNEAFDKALLYFRQALDMKKSIFNCTHPSIAKSHQSLGKTYLKGGCLEEALRHFQEAADIQWFVYFDELSSYPNMLSEIVDTSLNMGRTYQRMKCHLAAIDWFEVCETLQQEIHKDVPHEDVAIVLDHLGYNCEGTDQYDKALHYYEQCLKMNEQIYGDDNHPNIVVLRHKIKAVSLNGDFDEVSSRDNKSHLQEIADTYSLINKGKALQAMGQHEKAIEFLKQGLEILEDIYEGLPREDVAIVWSSLGTSFLALEQFDEALKHYQRGLEMRIRLVDGGRHPSTAWLHNQLGFVYQKLGRNDDALLHYGHAHKVQKVLYGDRPEREVLPHMAATMINMGQILQEQKSYHKAIECFKQSLKFQEGYYGNEPHADIVSVLDSLVECYKSLRKSNEALPYRKLRFAMGTQLVTEETRADVVLKGLNLGVIHFDDRQFAVALGYYRKARELQIQGTSPPQDEVTLSLLKNIGILSRHQKRYQEAIESLKEWLPIQMKIEKQSPDEETAEVLNHLAMCCQELRQFDDAVKYHKQSIDVRQRLANGRPHRGVADSYHNLGLINDAIGQHDQGVKHLVTGLEIRKAIFVKTRRPEVLHEMVPIFKAIGDVLQKMGRHKEANECFEKCSLISRLVHGEELREEVERVFDLLDISLDYSN